MLPVDCILDQIAKYSVGKTDESATLFVVYAGANDAYFSLEEGGTPAEVLEDLKLAIQALKDIGAACAPCSNAEMRMLTARSEPPGGKYFVVPTLPPIGENYPYAVSRSKLLWAQS